MPSEQPAPLVGILGARSLVGAELLSVTRESHPMRITCFSRTPPASTPDVTWDLIGEERRPGEEIPVVISLMPVWALVDHLPWLNRIGCMRLIALSSTSRFTKQHSDRAADRELSDRLARAESDIEAWAATTHVAATILRPTMIYGGPDDGNVSTMAMILRRFRSFPVAGRGQGLRQPVHARDVAWAAAHLAVSTTVPASSSYNLSGAEVLTYRELVRRVQRTVSGPTAIVTLPSWLFALAGRVAGRSGKVATAAGMASRASTDMVFDHASASEDFGFDPEGFNP